MNQETDEPFDTDIGQAFQRNRPVHNPVNIDRIVTPRHSVSFFDKRMLVMKTSFALAAATSAVFFWFVFATPSTGGSQAFAQVKQNVQKVSSVSFIQRSFSGKEKLPEGVFDARFPPGETAVSTLRKRIDETKTLLAEAKGTVKKDLHLKLRLLQSIPKDELVELDDLRWVRIGQKHLQRTDSLFPIGQNHSVIDAATNAHVSFDHRAKIKNVLTKQVVISRKGGKRTETKVEISPKADFFKQWQSIPAKAVRQKENRTIDNNELMVFQSVENHENGTWIRTYLVDPMTNLPFRIETEFKSTNSKISSSRWIQSQFVFDAVMPVELFSTETPAGYETKKAAIYGYGG